MLGSSLATRRSWSFCASSLARHQLTFEEACIRPEPTFDTMKRLIVQSPSTGECRLIRQTGFPRFGHVFALRRALIQGRPLVPVGRSTGIDS